jgi:hypothetical protein
MCDYSLAHFPNRLAVEGEKLVIHRFATGTLGLAPAHPTLKQVFSPNSVPAVCVPPGARLLLQDMPERLQQGLQVGAFEEVTFVQQSVEAFQYRDAVRFANGREIRLQELACGQRVDVLSLDSAPSERAELDERREVAAYRYERSNIL